MVPTYLSEFLPQVTAGSLFRALQNRLSWLKVADTRQEYFMSDTPVSYTFGERMIEDACDLTLVDFIREFNLKLKAGAHTPTDPNDPNCAVCLQEAEALRLALCKYRVKGETPPKNWWKLKGVWTDTPSSSWTDLRDLNDAPWSSEDVRTAALPLLEDRLRACPKQARQGVLKHVVDHLIRVTVAKAMRQAAALQVPKHKAAMEAAASRCEKEGTDAAARGAAEAAWMAEAWMAADAAERAAAAARATEGAAKAWVAAEAAARAARAATRAAAAAETPDAVLLDHVRVWHEALDAVGVLR